MSSLVMNTHIGQGNPNEVNFESNESACSIDQSYLITTKAIDIPLNQLHNLTWH